MVSQRVSQELTIRAKQFGFILDDISLTHLTFGREFTLAVEMKQVAQQEAEKARFVVEKAEQQKLASIISAEGDAEAAGLLAKSFGEAGDGLGSRDHRQQGSAECQHHAPHPVPSHSRPAAQDLHDPRPGLR